MDVAGLPGDPQSSSMWGELAPPTAPQVRLCHGQGVLGGFSGHG